MKLCAESVQCAVCSDLNLPHPFKVSPQRWKWLFRNSATEANKKKINKVEKLLQALLSTKQC